MISFSSTYQLPGVGPQGKLLGLIEYMFQSNGNADCVDEDLRFKFVDNLSVLELVMLSSLLAEYDFTKHVASDIGIDEHYVPPKSLKTQADLETISEWTDKNLMKLNTCKTKYMIFSRSETEIATRLAIKGQTIDRIEETKLVGVWLTTWLDWDKNTREICKKSLCQNDNADQIKVCRSGYS